MKTLHLANRNIAFLSPLILLAFFQMASAAQPSASIVEFGAVGDGNTVNTKAIQAAIDHLAAAGGGLLVVPKGTFVSGALFFKPSVNLRIEKGGVLKGTAVQADYPQVNTRWEGIEGLHTSAFLNFQDMTHVTVDGEGTIDGSGDAFPRISPPRGKNNPETRPATQTASAHPPAEPVLRPRLICLQNCQDVRFSNLHLQKQAIWCLHLLYCQDVVINNVNIRSTIYIPSSDGIDVDSCDGVLIQHCDIACTDDDIAIKSGKDDDGRRVNKASQHVTIQDCAIGSGEGIAIGSEVTGSVRHVLVERCTFTGTNHCARFKSMPSRGGEIADIVFRDITLHNAEEAFDFEMSWNRRLERAAPAQVLTLCHDIQLINFTGTCRNLGTLLGYPAQPIRDVKFVNCHLAADRGLRVQNATDLDTSGLDATVKQGPVIIGSTAAVSRPATVKE